MHTSIDTGPQHGPWHWELKTKNIRIISRYDIWKLYEGLFFT